MNNPSSSIANPTVITDLQAATRWEQSLALYTLFTQVWIDNPQLAKQAGRRVEELVMPLAEVQKRYLGYVKLPNPEVLNALKESDEVVARLKAGGKPRFDNLDDYFSSMDGWKLANTGS